MKRSRTTVKGFLSSPDESRYKAIEDSTKEPGAYPTKLFFLCYKQSSLTTKFRKLRKPRFVRIDSRFQPGKENKVKLD